VVACRRDQCTEFRWTLTVWAAISHPVMVQRTRNVTPHTPRSLLRLHRRFVQQQNVPSCGATACSGKWIRTIRLFSKGPHTVVVTATNSLGLSSDVSVTLVVVAGPGVPFVTISSPTDNTKFGPAQTIPSSARRRTRRTALFKMRVIHGVRISMAPWERARRCKSSWAAKPIRVIHALTSSRSRWPTATATPPPSRSPSGSAPSAS